MQAYRLETVVSHNCELPFESLPFHPGEAIEVIILARSEAGEETAPSSLKGSVLKYEDPTEPVAVPIGLFTSDNGVILGFE